MTNEAIAKLAKDGRRYEFTFPEYEITIRGPYVEWVLEAAAEMIGKIEKTKAESVVEELQLMEDFGGASDSDLEIEAAKYETNRRFETVPQCVVTMHGTDYRWVSRDGRADERQSHIQRLYDSSLTRNGTFLTDQQ